MYVIIKLNHVKINDNKVKDNHEYTYFHSKLTQRTVIWFKRNNNKNYSLKSVFSYLA